MHNEYMKRSGMARVLKEFHSSQFSRNRSSAIGMSHTCRCCCHSNRGSTKCRCFCSQTVLISRSIRTDGRPQAPELAKAAVSSGILSCYF